MKGLYESIGRLRDWSDEDSNNKILMLVQDAEHTTVISNNFTAFILAGIMQQSSELSAIISEAMEIYERRNR